MYRHQKRIFFIVLFLPLVAFPMTTEKKGLGRKCPLLMGNIAIVSDMIDSNDFDVGRELEGSHFGGFDASYRSSLWLDIGRKAKVEEFEVESDFKILVPTEAYIPLMDKEFIFKVKTLRSGQVYMDFGAGLAIAMRKLLKGQNSPTMIAISKKRPTKSQLHSSWHSEVDNLEVAISSQKEHFKYLEMDLDESNPEDVPRADVITDVAGWFTYTKKLKHALKVVNHALRNQESVFHLALPPNATFFHSGQLSPWHAENTLSDILSNPKLVKFETFMNDYVKGLRITHSHSNTIRPSPTDAYRIQKTAEPFHSPELVLEYFNPLSRVRIFRFN